MFTAPTASGADVVHRKTPAVIAQSASASLPTVFTGIVSDTMTPAGTTVGPLFVRVMVYVVEAPTFTVATPSVLVTARSAVFLTVLLLFTVLFAGVGSASVALTVAVFTYVPPGVAALTVTLIVITHGGGPRRDRRGGCT